MLVSSRPGLLQRNISRVGRPPLATPPEKQALRALAGLSPRSRDFQQLPVLLPLGARVMPGPENVCPGGLSRNQVFLDLHGGRGAQS